ncbi:SEC-C metal-binding domain-containing protein [Chloroflexota bacterium]
MTKVFTVRVDDGLYECIKGEAKHRHLVLNDYLKSILATYWRLPSRVIVNDNVEGLRQEIKELREELKSSTSPEERKETKEFPSKDVKGNPIPKAKWDIAIEHRNQACPCGSGKKFKRCCGLDVS